MYVLHFAQGDWVLLQGGRPQRSWTGSLRRSRHGGWTQISHQLTGNFFASQVKTLPMPPEKSGTLRIRDFSPPCRLRFNACPPCQCWFSKVHSTETASSTDRPASVSGRSGTSQGEVGHPRVVGQPSWLHVRPGAFRFIRMSSIVIVLFGQDKQTHMITHYSVYLQARAEWNHKAVYGRYRTVSFVFDGQLYRLTCIQNVPETTSAVDNQLA